MLTKVWKTSSSSVRVCVSAVSVLVLYYNWRKPSLLQTQFYRSHIKNAKEVMRWYFIDIYTSSLGIVHCRTWGKTIHWKLETFIRYRDGYQFIPEDVLKRIAKSWNQSFIANLIAECNTNLERLSPTHLHSVLFKWTWVQKSAALLQLHSIRQNKYHLFQ